MLLTFFEQQNMVDFQLLKQNKIKIKLEEVVLDR